MGNDNCWMICNVERNARRDQYKLLMVAYLYHAPMIAGCGICYFPVIDTLNDYVGGMYLPDWQLTYLVRCQGTLCMNCTVT